MLPLNDPSGIKTCIVISYAGEREYISDALQSCFEQTVETRIMLVIDGVATDSKSERIYLQDLFERIGFSNHLFQILVSVVTGPSALRNLGIDRSVCEFTLTLDADDKFGPKYVEEAEEIMGNNLNIGIVYGKARYFGLKNGFWDLPSFSRSEMALENQIYSSAMFRKDDWLQCGGFDEELIFGAEDWDFWLKILSLGREVHYLQNTTYFYYRQRSNSRSEKFAQMQREVSWTYNKIAENNLDFMKQNLLTIYGRRVHLENQNRQASAIAKMFLKSILLKSNFVHRMFKR